MENNEELWMQYIRQRTENSRDFLNRTGLVFGAGFGPGAALVSAPMFGMMVVLAQTGVFDPRTTVNPSGNVPNTSNSTSVPNASNTLYTSPMLQLWDMALKQGQQQNPNG
jgi:hypothetical protein